VPQSLRPQPKRFLKALGPFGIVNDVKRHLRLAENRARAALRRLPNIRGRPIALQEHLDVARNDFLASVDSPASIVPILLTIGPRGAAGKSTGADFSTRWNKEGGLSDPL
jgi:hypothetical protein